MKMLYVPVKVTPMPLTGKLVTIVDPLSAEVAEDQAMFGCWHCHIPLNEETFSTPCPGVDTEASPQ